jgi:hypothetical protein
MVIDLIENIQLQAFVQNNMVAILKLQLAVSLMAITNEPLELGA